MSWVHRLLGKDGSSQLGIDSTHFAARMSGRPMHLGANGGAYSFGAVSGVMAAGLAANSEIFQFRWTHATAKMLLRKVTIGGGGIAAFAAGHGAFTARVARAWSADGTGGTPVIWAGNDQKKRTDFVTTKAPSNLGVRIASTAALGAGTKTLDTNDFSNASFGVTATAGASLGAPHGVLWLKDTSDEYPFLFEQNEGFVIRATVPATGTWTFGVTVEWAEIEASEVEGWT